MYGGYEVDVSDVKVHTIVGGKCFNTQNAMYKPTAANKTCIL